MTLAHSDSILVNTVFLKVVSALDRRCTPLASLPADAVRVERRQRLKCFNSWSVAIMAVQRRRRRIKASLTSAVHRLNGDVEGGGFAGLVLAICQRPWPLPNQLVCASGTWEHSRTFRLLCSGWLPCRHCCLTAAVSSRIDRCGHLWHVAKLLLTIRSSPSLYSEVARISARCGY